MTSTTYESENDYEIQIKDYLTGEYISLGSGDYCSVKFDGVGSPDLRESVFDVSGGDGIQFGTEYVGAVNWTITGAIHAALNANVVGSSADTWNAWSVLARAWTHYPERKIPRAVVPLYFKRPGREQMVVFGRPNRIDPETTRSYSGFISYTASFRQSDPKFYSSNQTILNLSLDTPYVGGLLLNNDQDAFLIPLQTSVATARTGTIFNSGDTDTHPVITLNGGVNSPQVNLYSDLGALIWSIKLSTPIPAGTSVTIDTRNWARTITSSQGTSWAGAYIGDKLQDIIIPPGASIFEYLGSDPTGTSTCQVLFRNAWASL